MIATNILEQALGKAASSPDFGKNAWLTFYLCDQPDKLESLAIELAERGGVNLDGVEGGFLYAKMPVQLDAHDIERVASETSALARKHSIEVDLIDLDSSADVTKSKFFTLYKAPRSVGP